MFQGDLYASTSRLSICPQATKRNSFRYSVRMCLTCSNLLNTASSHQLEVKSINRPADGLNIDQLSSRQIVLRLEAKPL